MQNTKYITVDMCLTLAVSLLRILSFTQGLLKKHEAFETDFTVHRDRVSDVCTNGEELIKKVGTTPRPEEMHLLN